MSSEKRLLLHKYTPKSFSESVLNKNIIRIIKSYISDNILNNIVLYGPNGNGKYTLAMLLLNELYNSDVYKKKLIDMVLDNGKTIELISSIYHFEIYANHYSLNDKTSLVHLLEKLATNKNINTNDYNVIVIKNCQYLKKEVFFTIKKFSEKYVNNCRFILLTNNINIFKNLIANFIYIRIPLETTENISNYLYDIIKTNGNTGTDVSVNNNFTLDSITKLVTKLTNNLSDIMIHIDYKLLNGCKYIDYYESKISLIIKLLETKKISNLIKIREIVYDLTCKNIEKKKIIIKIVKHFITSKKYSHKVKELLISNGRHFEEKLQNAYKDFVHLEAFLITSMNILVQ